MAVVGSMGAGGAGSETLSYSQSVGFTFNAIGSPFQIALLGSSSLGSGFQSALFQIFDNGNVLLQRSFGDLASAQAYFFNQLLDLQLGAGLHDIQVAFAETLAGGQGFAFDYAANGVAATPLPPSWTMTLVGLAGFMLFVYCRRRQARAT